MYTIPVTLEKTISRIKREIIADVLAGYVPVDCASFSSLHDYRDANTYGGLCDDEVFNSMIEHFGGRDKNEGMPDGFANYITLAQQGVNTWLQDGGLARDCPPPGWNAIDPAYDDLLNRHRRHPYFSVYEKTIGGNGYPICNLTVLREDDFYRPAHGSIVMTERFVSATAAAEIAMTWAVENGWSTDDMRSGFVAGNDLPIPAFSASIHHLMHTVNEGRFSGKVLGVANGVVTQKIDREGNTVRHEASKLSIAVQTGDVVHINYVGARGIVSGISQKFQGVGR